MTNLLKNLLFALGLVVVLFLGYQVFIASDSDENSLATGQANRESQEILARLSAIKAIEIDRSIFSDFRFTSLVNFRQELEDEPTGRQNPFEPVE